MFEPVRLFIVTDDARKACLAVMGCHLEDCPSFVKVLTSPDEIRAIPDGARCIGQWFAWSNRRQDPAQMAWDWRKAVGGMEGVGIAFFDRIDEWNVKRREAEARTVAQALSEARDAPVMSFADFSNAQAAASAGSSDTVQRISQQSRWH